jgi:hypothetical protein
MSSRAPLCRWAVDAGWSVNEFRRKEDRCAGWAQCSCTRGTRRQITGYHWLAAWNVWGRRVQLGVGSGRSERHGMMEASNRGRSPRGVPDGRAPVIGLRIRKRRLPIRPISGAFSSHSARLCRYMTGPVFYSELRTLNNRSRLARNASIDRMRGCTCLSSPLRISRSLT